jgi:hypothetical protein
VDAAGTLLGVGYGYADLEVIKPQGISSFSLSIPNLAEGEVSGYQFLGRGQTGRIKFSEMCAEPSSAGLLKLKDVTM